MKSTHSVIFKDILWYFIGSIIPLLVGLLKSPIYTRVFSTEDFGAYTLTISIFSYLSIICYSWIVSCVFRYYYQYKKRNEIHRLYSNLLFLYLLFSGIVLLFSFIWFFFADNELIRRLILLCSLQFLTSELLSLFFVRPRLEGRTFYYNFIQSIRAFGSFGLLLLLTFVFHFGIEAYLISNIAFNIFFILCIVLPDCIKLKLNPSFVNKLDLNTFLGFGKIGLVINICIALLVSFDRILIEFFTGLHEVGIYGQNYNIAQITIALLIQVYCSSLNPHLFNLLDEKPPSLRDNLYGYFKIYFFCFAPITLYFVLYAKNIAHVMLGEEFRTGYQIIFWAAIAEFINGLCFLTISKLKFANQFRLLSGTFIAAVIINVGLNLICIPIFGYKSAAITTVVAYIFLFVTFTFKDDAYSVFSLLKNRKFKFCIALLLGQSIVHLFSASRNLPQSYYITEGVLFAAMYAAIAIRYKWIDFGSIHVQPRTTSTKDNINNA